MAKQFIKKITVAVCMILFLGVIALMTYAYVVPVILSADIPGIITLGINGAVENATNIAKILGLICVVFVLAYVVGKKIKKIKAILCPTTNEPVKVHENNVDQTNTKQIKTNQNVKQIDNPDQIDVYPQNNSDVKSGTVAKLPVDNKDTLNVENTKTCPTSTTGFNPRGAGIF